MEIGEPAATDAGRDIVVRDCPACGSSLRRGLPRYSRPPWQIVRCDECEFVYLAQAPSYERLFEELSWDKQYAAEHLRRRRQRPASYWTSRGLRVFHRLGRKWRKARALSFAPGPVLDVGCGGGTNVPAGNVPYGIEISRSLHEIADPVMRARGGYAVHAPAIEGIGGFPDSFFTGAILSSYLEHEVQPRELLAELARVLRPGGRVYVRVPNFSSVNRMVRGVHWSGIRLPDHVNYFTVEGLRRMAGDTGFDFRLLNMWIIPFDDNINAMFVRRHG